MDLNMKEKPTIAPRLKRVGQPNWTDRLTDFWNERIMNNFLKANLFIICCIAAGILMLSYLLAFSCEVSWILEAKGDLPVSSYTLSLLYFVTFIASTILIHGLATKIAWGLFAWSSMIAIFSIPELALVMIMTTQHWGLQSVHGLTELISYLIRVVINCTALLCIIPTALKWKRETKVLTQLQNLAIRLQLQTPPPSVPLSIDTSRMSSKRILQANAFDNPGFIVNEILQAPSREYLKNEFNANVFCEPLPPPPPQFGAPFFTPNHIMEANAKRAQSLMDLRTTLPGVFNTRYVHGTDDIDAIETSSKLNPNICNALDENKKNLENLSMLDSVSGVDPIYCTIKELKQKSSRNRQAISLENLGGVADTFQKLQYDPNILLNYQKQLHYWAMLGYPIIYPSQNNHGMPRRHSTISKFPFASDYLRESPIVGGGDISYGGFTSPFAINYNSRKSVGNELNDYRKY